jgi:chemotaxis protein MotB
VNRRSSPSKVSLERWLVSYADFITLLFAFFVVLYAFAKADEKKQAQVAAAIDSGFRALSILPPGNGPAMTDHARSANQSAIRTPQMALGEARLYPDVTARADLQRIQRDLEQRLATQIAGHVVAVQLGRDGLVISLREAGFFKSGSATPKPETAPTLHQVADALRSTPYDVRVEGHTDNVPIHNSEFDSNWELSTARAVRIARMFLELHAIRPEQLSADGFAEYRPVGENGSVEGRAQNRRVDIVVMPRAILDLAESEPSPDRSAWRKIVDK